jgi:multidrug efflux pump subunit AcrB
MNPAAFFVRNWQLSAILFVLLAALGVQAWLAIPRGEDPPIDFPAYSVVAVYPGAGPRDVEQLVAEPIERRLAELDDVKRVNSQSRDGLAVVYIEFHTGVDVDRKYDAVLREVNELRPELPRELASLDVTRFSSTNVNIAQVALVSSAAPYSELEDRAKALRDRFNDVPGVKRAQIWAIPLRQVRVSLDLGRLAQLGIPTGRVLQAISADNDEIPGGSVDVGGRRFDVKASGAFTSLDQVRNTVVATSAGRVTRLGDVATVAWGYADPTYIGRYDGKRAVFVTASQTGKLNIARVRDALWRELDGFQRTLPATIRLERGFDQSKNVSARLAQLGRDFAIALLLVLVTLLPLGLRASGIVMVSIPLSVALGLALLSATGFTLNQLSIVGFVIALGLLVDDSIVVTENIARFLRNGYTRREAAIAATRQIAVAVLGCTATLILAFLPLVFLPGGPGEFIRVLPLTVIYTIAASLLIALTVTPWLGSVLMRESADARGNVFMRALTGGIARSYAPLLRGALRRPAVTLAAAAAMVVASLALIPAVGFSLFPKAGTPQFLVDIETPEGTALSATDSVARFVERTLAHHPQVRTVFTSVGQDNPQIYYNVIPRHEDPTVAQLFVLLRRYDSGRTPALMDTLRAEVASYPGARIRVRELENGTVQDAPIAMRVSGPDLDTLRTIAAQMERVFQAMPGTMYVENPIRNERTDLRVVVDRGKAGMLGIAGAEVNRSVRLGIAGLTAARYREGDGDEYDIAVSLPRAGAGMPGPGQLDRVYLASLTGAAVPLRQVADLRFEASAPIIRREQQKRTATVAAWVRTGFNTDRVTRNILAELGKLRLPPGYTLSAAGEIESRQESFGGVGNAVIVAVFLILAVLVLEFGSFRSTLIVASVIPLGLVGGILALLLSGYTLSFTATVGFVALVGIEIKTSILLVDFTNQLREQGVPLLEAIQRAGEVRFVPVVLTTLTAIGGLLPLALEGSSMYSPLAWVIIGGLLSSTLMARVVTPVMYRLLPPAVAPAPASLSAAD